MSYLSELKNRQITAKDFLAQSVKYLKAKTGFAPSDDAVDVAVKAADVLTDAIEVAVAAYIATTGLPLPAKELATSAASGVLNHLDAAIAGAGNVIKDNN